MNDIQLEALNEMINRYIMNGGDAGGFMDWGAYNFIPLWHKVPLQYRCFAYKYDAQSHSSLKEKYMAKEYAKSDIKNYCDDEWAKF